MLENSKHTPPGAGVGGGGRVRTHTHAYAWFSSKDAWNQILVFGEQHTRIRLNFSFKTQLVYCTWLMFIDLSLFRRGGDQRPESLVPLTREEILSSPTERWSCRRWQLSYIHAEPSRRRHTNTLVRLLKRSSHNKPQMGKHFNVQRGQRNAREECTVETHQVSLPCWYENWVSGLILFSHFHPK